MHECIYVRACLCMRAWAWALCGFGSAFAQPLQGVGVWALGSLWVWLGGLGVLARKVGGLVMGLMDERGWRIGQEIILPM